MSNIKSMMLPEEVDVDNYSANMPPVEAKVDTRFSLPRAINNSSCIFQIDNAGILDMEHSKIVLQGKSSVGNNDKVAYPVPCGIASYIQRAILRGANGGGVICTSDNFGNYFAISNTSFTSTDRKANVDRYLNGTFNAYNVNIDNAANNNVYDGVGNVHINVMKSTIHAIRSDPDEGSNYSLKLNQLFPGFLRNDIPVFALKDGLEIELIFTPDNGVIGDRVISCDNTSTDTDNSPIAEGEVMLLTDHIYFSDERMMNIRMSFDTSPFVANYTDIQATRDSLGGTGNTTATTSNHKIGGAGKVVSSVLFSNPRTDITDDAVLACMGKYGSDSCLEKKCFNLSVNNKKVLPIDVSNMNSAIVFALLSSMYDNNYCDIPYALYAQTQKIGLNDKTFNGRANYAGINGQLSYSGIQLDDTKINAVPIDLELYRLSTTGGGLKANDLYVFLMVKRVLTIQNGVISVSYS
jgi:hypothetical protein